ncbi:MAG: transketolase family protein [Candidatus Gastranaerophilales bacterium]|nr:transketolase family protein [Candidatus Gastranaerophilales bacterium]
MLSNKQIAKSPRATYGQILVELGKENPNIVVIDADLSCSTQTKQFADVFPERFFNVGVAEQDAICTAAGLSTCGKIAFVSTFAMFATGRAWDQVRNTVCYPKFNVKIVATHGGVTVGEDGASHQALEDVSLMRSIPNMMVFVPSDCTELKAILKFSAEYHGPVYIRVPRSSMPEIFDENNYKFENKAKIISEGTDITLISNGETLIEAIKAKEMLSEKNISAEVINCPVIKPLDNKTIIQSAKKTKKVVTIENHSIIGGLGSAISECLSENYPVLLKRIGTNDVFGQSGEASELMVKYGLTAITIFEKSIELMGNNS